MKKMITLYADNGMILTDGKNYGTTISLATGKTEENYYEITKEEYENILAEEEKEHAEN